MSVYVLHNNKQGGMVKYFIMYSDKTLSWSWWIDQASLLDPDLFWIAHCVPNKHTLKDVCKHCGLQTKIWQEVTFVYHLFVHMDPLIYDYLFELLRLIILHTQKKISDLSEDIKYVFSLTRQKVSDIKVQF